MGRSAADDVLHNVREILIFFQLTNSHSSSKEKYSENDFSYLFIKTCIMGTH